MRNFFWLLRLIAIIKNPNTPDEERLDAQFELNRQPRDASRSRIRGVRVLDDGLELSATLRVAGDDFLALLVRGLVESVPYRGTPAGQLRRSSLLLPIGSVSPFLKKSGGSHAASMGVTTLAPR